jgi:hypothetical protein
MQPLDRDAPVALAAAVTREACGEMYTHPRRLLHQRQEELDVPTRLAGPLLQPLPLLEELVHRTEEQAEPGLTFVEVLLAE